MRYLRFLVILMASGILLFGCGKKADAGLFDDIANGGNKTAGSNGSNSIQGEMKSDEYEAAKTVLSTDMEGVVEMNEFDDDLLEASADYVNYEFDTSVGIEREEDGTIPFHIGDVTFIYNQDIDIQLVTEENSNVIYVKGLDPIGSQMYIGIYSGNEYQERYNQIIAEDHMYYDINGNVYWTGQSVDNGTWYYAYQDVLEPCVIVVKVTGDFKQNNLKICLPVPERYDVSRE